MTESQLNDERKKMAEEISARRKYLQLSQQDLADKCGIHAATVSRIEKGHFSPTMKQYLILLEALDMRRVEPEWK